MTSDEVDEVYGITEPAAHAAHYDKWAATYDESMLEGTGYIAPGEIARRFRERFSGQRCLDIGAGTGLVAESLNGVDVDGIDISANMLAVAEQKGLYRERIVADLTQSLPIADTTYDGFISAGTFTHGHVGPGCLPELLRIARPNALFSIGMVVSVFDEAGFGSAFALLVASGAITPVEFDEIAVYAGVDHPHAADTAFVAHFHKRG